MYLEELNIVNTNPNFTIVLPVGCNADCSFCSWKTVGQEDMERSKDFLKNLKNVLEKLPEEFEQITISGGEPTLYKELNKVLMLIGYHKGEKIKKVVFTTNGVELRKWINNDLFTEVVDFVNISRHHYIQEENNKIMGFLTPSWYDIIDFSEDLGDYGIPVNINCVIPDIDRSIMIDFFSLFVNNARECYVNSITFRKDYAQGFGMSELEQIISKKKKAVQISECPVCMKNKYVEKGMDIYFTTSEEEPKDVLGSAIYEFILQPNGDLTIDWEGKEVVSLEKPPTGIRKIEPIGKPYNPAPIVEYEDKFGGCGNFRGCGM